MRKVYLYVSLGLMCAIIAGCGGHGGGSSGNRLPMSGNETISSSDTTLGDGSKCDTRTFYADESGYVTITMSRSGGDPVGDPYLMIYSGETPSAETFLGSDDDDGPGLDAYYNFWVSSGNYYSVRFNTRSSGDLGTYSYSIHYDNRSQPMPSAEPGDKPTGDAPLKLSQ